MWRCRDAQLQHAVVLGGGLPLEDGLASLAARYYCHACGVATTSETNLQVQHSSQRHAAAPRREAWAGQSGNSSSVCKSPLYNIWLLRSQDHIRGKKHQRRAARAEADAADSQAAGQRPGGSAAMTPPPRALTPPSRPGSAALPPSGGWGSRGVSRTPSMQRVSSLPRMLSLQRVGRARSRTRQQMSYVAKLGVGDCFKSLCGLLTCCAPAPCVSRCL